MSTSDDILALQTKCSSVIVSCKTKEQLISAEKYAKLAYKKLSTMEYVSIEKSMFIGVIEKSIGFALCKIHYGIS